MKSLSVTIQLIDSDHHDAISSYAVRFLEFLPKWIICQMSLHTLRRHRV